MRKLLAGVSAITLLGGASAATDPSALKFGGERIGVPSLSLSESIAQRGTPPQSWRFIAPLPTTGSDSPDYSPKLLPKSAPNIMRLDKNHTTRSHHVSPLYGMPIIVPGDAVDYKMKVVPPDPSVDFKMVIKDPMPHLQPHPIPGRDATPERESGKRPR